jgi:hypothetical protein
LTAALLATFAVLLSELFNPFLDFVYYGIVFGAPVAAGALLGATWRRVLGRSAKSAPK